MFNYPLNINFKIISWGPQMSITDANGNLVLYVKQKALKLKEAVTVYRDAEQTQPLYYINADRVIDFSASYTFNDQVGNVLGAVKRKGMKSLWKAHYDIFDGNTSEMSIQEESPFIRFADGCVNQIPIVGLFAGYFLNPTYLVASADGTPVMRLSKLPAFFEGKFMIEKLAELSDAKEKRVLLALLMMILLERIRG
jgi:hypothetical protein